MSTTPAKRGDELAEEDHLPFLAKLRDGKEILVQSCDCGSCKNQFFVPYVRSFSPGESDAVEWMPSFCPFCGIKFAGRIVDGVPVDFNEENPEVDFEQSDGNDARHWP